LIEKITNNFWWKLLSLLLGFLLWLVIVNVEDPQTTRVFYDIKVAKINEEVITSEKKAIEYREGETVNVKVRGKRSIVDRMTAKDIVAVADLQKKSITGAIDIEIEVPDTLTILEKEPSMMMVKLESIITVQKEVQPYMIGEPGDGYIYLDPVVTPNNIEVEGPESKIGLIKSVLVPVKIDGVKRDVILYGSPQIIDESNNEIAGLTKSASQVQIQVPIEKLKVVNIKENIEETNASGYELVGITLSQNTLSVRGKEELIDLTETLMISGIDISQLTEDTILTVNAKSLLPAGISVYKDVDIIEVYIDIEAIEEKTLILTHDDINVRHLSENLQFSYVDDEVFELKYQGISSKLETIDIERISPSISLRDLEEGTHEVEISLFTPSGVELLTDKPKVVIELSKVEEAVEEETIGSTETIINP
jgi:hypothetical protein